MTFDQELFNVGGEGHGTAVNGMIHWSMVMSYKWIKQAIDIVGAYILNQMYLWTHSFQFTKYILFLNKGKMFVIGVWHDRTVITRINRVAWNAVTIQTMYIFMCCSIANYQVLHTNTTYVHNGLGKSTRWHLLDTRCWSHPDPSRNIRSNM